MKFVDITGNKYGMLTVLSFHDSNKGNTRWLCECDCGNTSIVSKNHLKSVTTRSCGCLSRKMSSERLITHGKSKTRLYIIWNNIVKRCYHEHNEHYKDYGGRGILLCDEWKNNFIEFYNWAFANGYKKDLEIDRKDNNGNYEPENCRWVTRSVNMNNTRVSTRILFNGEVKTLAELARINGISYEAARWRYKRNPKVKSK